MKRFRRLRVRLVLWTVALEALLLFVFSGVLVLVLQHSLRQQIDEKLRLSASQLNAVVDVRSGQFVVPSRDADELRAREVSAWILTPQGEVSATVGDADHDPLPAHLPSAGHLADSHLANGEPMRLLVTPLLEGDRPLGTLVLVLSLRNSQDVIEQMVLGLGTVIPIVLGLSAVGGWFLASRALSPVVTITNMARQIGAADLSQRLALDLPDDEIGHLAHTFDGMLERLDHAFQRERQLTSDVSHELRTPLGMIKTQLSLARSRPRDAATLLQMMVDMEGDVDRMTQLVEQMLTLARVEQRGLADFELVALDELLRGVIDQFQVKAHEHGVMVFLELPPQVDWHLKGDRERLRMVFANLVDNAIKYTPSARHVMVSASRQWQTISVAVTDTGMGVAPEHLPHLFERFYRVDSARARDTGGVGLGLAIAQAIVLAHHGQIQVDSTVGVGTTFYVTLLAAPTLDEKRG